MAKIALYLLTLSFLKTLVESFGLQKHSGEKGKNKLD